MAASLSLQADKQAQKWSRNCLTRHLTPHQAPKKNAPQDHSSINGVLSEVTVCFKNAEYLCPIVAAQREVDREMCIRERLPPTVQRVIITTSAAEGLTI